MCAVKKAIQPEELEELFKEGDQHNRVEGGGKWGAKGGVKQTFGHKIQFYGITR